MKLLIELDEKRFKDIQRIASIQIRRKSLTCEQIIANGTPLEEELENIKEEIKQYTLENKNFEDLDLWSVWRDGAYYSLTIIDKHIADLKGEKQWEGEKQWNAQ